MKVEISITEPEKSYSFAGIKLSYMDSSIVAVKLNIDYRNLYEFTKTTSGISFDLFLVSCVVYGIDILLPRIKASNNNWNRNIEVCFPVENLDNFNNVRDSLQALLSFLTCDNWSITFQKRDTLSMYKHGIRGKVFKETYRKQFKMLNLFSGGMDSLIGAIDSLQNSSDNLLLVSHCDSMFKGAQSDQNNLIEVLSKEYEHFKHLQTNVSMDRYDVNGVKYEKETTLRSRSFLFLSLANFVASTISNNLVVNIPENGTISLNYPLTPSRMSSCSTRTTHPFFISSYNRLLKELGLNTRVDNKYQFCTKSEMTKGCGNLSLLKRLYYLSCSCGKRGTRKDIRDDEHAHNCGVCMPCIYRRCALWHIDLSEAVGTDIFSPIKRKIEDIPDMPALMSFLRENMTTKDIKQELLTNATLDLNQMDKYAAVICRTREELKRWIVANADKDTKKKFGLI